MVLAHIYFAVKIYSPLFQGGGELNILFIGL